MADDKKPEVKADEKSQPVFVTTTQFFDGAQLHPAGTTLVWAVPDGWDAKLNGPHYMARGPSQTFKPMNAEAEALQRKHAQVPEVQDLDAMRQSFERKLAALQSEITKLTAAKK